MKKLIIIMALLIMGLNLGCGRKETLEPKVEPQLPPKVVEKPKAVAEKPKAISLIVADFDRGEKPNNLGGDFGTWDKDPNDQTMYIHMSFNRMAAKDGEEFCVRLDYDVDSPNPAYNGLWMKLEGLDLRPYKNLVLDVKGDSNTGYTSQFKLELKNTKGEVGKYILRNVTDQWQEFVITLEKFRGISDWSEMTEFVIVFADIEVSQKVGTIYIDNVRFTN